MAWPLSEVRERTSEPAVATGEQKPRKVMAPRIHGRAKNIGLKLDFDLDINTTSGPLRRKERAASTTLIYLIKYKELWTPAFSRLDGSVT